MVCECVLHCSHVRICVRGCTLSSIKLGLIQIKNVWFLIVHEVYSLYDTRNYEKFIKQPDTDIEDQLIVVGDGELLSRFVGVP